MPRALVATYYLIRDRVTGLNIADGLLGVPRWHRRGRLFRSKRQLHGFLASLPDVPREWEVMPVELVARDDRLGAADAVLAIHKERLAKAKARRRRRGQGAE